MPTQSVLDPMTELGIPRQAMPRSIAVIMDGNGRWAQQRGMPRIEGHRNSSISVRETVTQCARLGIEALTLYSFSLENWKRPAAEVTGLMELYAHYLAAERQTILENDIRVVQIGRREGLPDAVLHELDLTLAASASNTGLTLCLALNYGSRDEICDAVRDIARQVQAGTLSPDAIDEALISSHLYTAGIPDPDLLIRTAGQMRISNFLLWQISYAELVVTDVLWPDFRTTHLHDAIREFARRERRFGDVGGSGARK